MILTPQIKTICLSGSEIYFLKIVKITLLLLCSFLNHEFTFSGTFTAIGSRIMSALQKIINLLFFVGVNMWVNWHKQAEVCANRVRACYMALQGAEARRSTQSLTSTATCSCNPPPLRPPKKLQDLSKMNENETWRLQERKKTSSSLSYLAFKPRIKADNAL